MHRNNGKASLGIYFGIVGAAVVLIAFQNFVKYEPLKQDTDELFMGGSLTSAIKSSEQRKVRRVALNKNTELVAEPSQRDVSSGDDLQPVDNSESIEMNSDLSNDE
jgi:hypothetical protein